MTKYRVRIPVQVETLDGHEMPSITSISVIVNAESVEEARLKTEKLIKRNDLQPV